MFSGIIQAICKVSGRTEASLCVDMPTEGLVAGASVSVDGVCLTAAILEPQGVWFDLTEETLRLTTLKNLQVGDLVHIERALKYGQEIGGHFVSGHIFQRVEILSINDNVYTFSAPQKNFLLPKGFIALNGVSLTICDPNEKSFCIHFVKETLARTTFAQKKVGDEVNLEYDLHLLSDALYRST